jgi:hypothetical protein
MEFQGCKGPYAAAGAGAGAAAAGVVSLGPCISTKAGI